eukprot:scaffold54190_cov20-Tisochrysis_lutea.AAC.2
MESLGPVRAGAAAQAAAGLFAWLSARKDVAALSLWARGCEECSARLLQLRRGVLRQACSTRCSAGLRTKEQKEQSAETKTLAVLAVYVQIGDLVVHLAEAAREELDKPVRDISRPRLQSLLELAIRTSSVAQDPHADELSVELDPRSVLELSRDAGALTLGSTATVSVVCGSSAGCLWEHGNAGCLWQR